MHWRQHGYDFNVAVNISAINLQDKNFIETIWELCRVYKYPAPRLELEITESAIMADVLKAKASLSRLDQHGCKLSIDDFGTGYSSLSYLKELPVDELKIDKSFVLDMCTDDSDAVIVRSTIDLAHNLGLSVTAEGVEREDARDLLDLLSCDYMQGHFFAAPMPLAALTVWLNDWYQQHGIHRNGVETVSVPNSG